MNEHCERNLQTSGKKKRSIREQDFSSLFHKYGGKSENNKSKKKMNTKFSQN